jgi:hypothetical protein
LNKRDPKYGTLWSVGAAFFDYDGDGWLDLFVSNYCIWDPQTEPACGPEGKRDYCHPRHYEGLPNSLYRNRGDGTFEDVSVETGIRPTSAKGMGIGVADFDDGRPPRPLRRERHPAGLPLPQRGGKRFKEIAVEAGDAYTYYGTAVSGMGVDARDLDNDGRPDIFVTAMLNEAFPLYLNRGGNVFERDDGAERPREDHRQKTGWSTGVYDFNNDGWKDILVASGGRDGPAGHHGAAGARSPTRCS